MTPASCDPVRGLQPKVPKDFQVFINLVDLCRYGTGGCSDANVVTWCTCHQEAAT